MKKKVTVRDKKKKHHETGHKQIFFCRFCPIDVQVYLVAFLLHTFFVAFRPCRDSIFFFQGIVFILKLFFKYFRHYSWQMKK